MEEWRDIKEYEGLYQVSNLGRVRSLDYNHTGKEVKRQLGFSQGNVCLCCKGKYKQIYGYKWQYKERAA